MAVLKRMLRYILARKLLALAIVAMVMISQIAELTIPLVVGLAIDSILTALQANSFQTAIIINGVIIIVVVSLIRGLTIFCARYLGYVQGERIIYTLRNELFRKYEYSSVSFHDHQHTGDLMTRAMTDMEPISEFLVWGQRAILQAFFTYIGIFIALYFIDFTIFQLMVVATPLLLLISYILSRKQGPMFFKNREQYGRLTNTIQENIVGAQIVRAFNAFAVEKEKFDHEAEEFLKLRAYTFRIRSIFIGLINLVVNLLITCLIVLGGLAVINHQLTPGILVTLFTYFGTLAHHTRLIAMTLIQYQRLVAAGQRIFSLLDSTTSLPESSSPVSLPSDVTPKISFDNVSFVYDNKRILHNVSFAVNPGEKIAIIGATGAGKSMLVSLIPRFYDITVGKISLSLPNGEQYDLRELNINNWRQTIGFVHQETYLFSRSLAENIAFGLETIDIAKVRAAAQIAQIDDFIKSLPENYNTLIGERGVTLSGGQKQRVAIARMLLRDPNIMIMDDATSSLDISTEYAFQSALTSFLNSSRKHTVIFITQRLSTIKMADRVIILHRGRIVEQGSHNELMQNGKVYPILWRTQEEGILDIKMTLEKIAQEMEF